MPNDPSIILPNEALEVALDACSEVLGIPGVKSIIRHAQLDYPIVDGKLVSEKNPTFRDVGKVTETFFDIYGNKGAVATLKRSGRVMFEKWHESNPAALNTAGAALKVMSPEKRIKAVLNVVKLAAKHIAHVETDVKEDKGNVYFAAFQCPFCAGVEADHTYCYSAVGALEAVSKWATKEIWDVSEIKCMSLGHQACIFKISPPQKKTFSKIS